MRRNITNRFWDKQKKFLIYHVKTVIVSNKFDNYLRVSFFFDKFDNTLKSKYEDSNVY